MADTAPCVLIMAGGTGGHVFPALAVATELRARGARPEWLGTARGIESRLVPAADIPLHCMTVGGLRGKGFADRVRGVFGALAAVWQCLGLIRRLRPVSALGMGGYASGPGGIAARMMRVPLIVHEQNAVAGTTNRLLARIATRVMTAFPIELGGERNRHVGNPVRAAIAALPDPVQRWVGREGPVRVLVLGGSLGAKPLNDVVIEALSAIPAEQRPLIWHQCGAAHEQDVQQAYRTAGIAGRVAAFIESMEDAYGWADVVLCRAGALTVSELAAAGVGSVLVPLPHAIDDHQTANARWLSDAGAAQLLPQSELSAARLTQLLTIFDRNKLLSVACAARKLAITDAAARVADACLEAADAR